MRYTVVYLRTTYAHPLLHCWLDISKCAQNTSLAIKRINSYGPVKASRCEPHAEGFNPCGLVSKFNKKSAAKSALWGPVEQLHIGVCSSYRRPGFSSHSLPRAIVHNNKHLAKGTPLQRGTEIQIDRGIKTHNSKRKSCPGRTVTYQATPTTK